MDPMKAAMRDRYGPPEIVEIREIERPEPTADQVLVRVHAASVNRADLDGLYPRWQFTRLFLGLRRPRSQRLGLDVAGVVESVGPDVTGFRPGDRVYGDLFSFPDGAFSEVVCVPERAFARIPDHLSFEEAATLPHSAILALQGTRLRNGRTFKAGDRVLVDGASGNVGPFVVQIARARGAHVTGVCSTDKVDFVRSLGADEVIDYTKVDYTKAGKRYDWIVAVDAHHGYWGVRRAIAVGGAYVAMGGSAAWMLSSLFVAPLLTLRGNRWMGLLMWWKPFQVASDDVATLATMTADGTLRPVIDRRYPLDQVVEALRYVDDGQAMGKVVVTMD